MSLLSKIKKNTSAVWISEIYPTIKRFGTVKLFSLTKFWTQIPSDSTTIITNDREISNNLNNYFNEITKLCVSLLSKRKKSTSATWISEMYPTIKRFMKLKNLFSLKRLWIQIPSDTSRIITNKREISSIWKIILLK